MSRAVESIVYGVHAALAVARHRPEAIQRVLYTEARRNELGPLLKAAASRHRPYREVEPDALERVAKTVHHEGVVVVADPIPLVPFEALFDPAARRPDDLFVALDGVANPHNLGAILRSCAWFGARALIVAAAPRQAALSASAVRVAQGGAEVVACVGVPDLAEALATLGRAGVVVAGAEPDGRRVAFAAPLPRPLCLVFGAEATGLTPAVRAACAEHVRIPGTGAIQSLNVAVAAGVLLAAATTSAPAPSGPRRPPARPAKPATRRPTGGPTR